MARTSKKVRPKTSDPKDLPSNDSVAEEHNIRFPSVKLAADEFATQHFDCHSCAKEFSENVSMVIPVKENREYIDKKFCKPCGNKYLSATERVDITLPRRVIINVHKALTEIKAEDINSKANRSDYILKAILLMERELENKKYNEI